MIRRAAWFGLVDESLVILEPHGEQSSTDGHRTDLLKGPRFDTLLGLLHPSSLHSRLRIRSHHLVKTTWCPLTIHMFTLQRTT
jgi:hypothetical protein